MSEERIVFLAANASYSHTNLAGWYLRGIGEAAGWQWREVEVLQTDSMSAALQKVCGLKPDVLAASFYLFNARFLLSFISRFKALRPDCRVIGGGPEFLGDNASFLERHPEIDAVIRGEGERAFGAWLECWNKPEQWGQIGGLCAFIGGKYVDNGKAELVKNLDEIPSPYIYNLACGDFRPGRARPLAEPSDGTAHPEGSPYQSNSCHIWQSKPGNFSKPFLLLETSRGCSNRCAYCTSAGEGLRFFSLERARNDLKTIAAAGIKAVRLADRTFNDNPERCLELLKIMRDEFGEVKFHLEIDPARVSDEMIRELGRAGPGRFHLEVGIQSLSPQTQNAVGRRGSLERAFSTCRQLCRLRNIAVHVDLIAGLPGGGLADVYSDLRAMALEQPDEIQLELLKILPGTRLSIDREKLGLVAAPEPPYEILQTPVMSHADLVAARRLSNLVDWFYNARELRQMLVEAFGQDRGFIEKFLVVCGERAEAGHAPALENRFRLLEQYFRANAPELIARLAYEWLKWGLSAQHGICRASQWKKPLPKEAVFLEGDANIKPRRMYLAELERPYLFVYGVYPRRGPAAIYTLELPPGPLIRGNSRQ